jgi:hypothetical protein
MRSYQASGAMLALGKKCSHQNRAIARLASAALCLGSGTAVTHARGRSVVIVVLAMLALGSSCTTFGGGPRRHADALRQAGDLHAPAGLVVPVAQRNEPNSQSLTNRDIWRPAPHTSWQWQLIGPVDLSIDAAMYDIDLFDNAASVISTLHARGRRAICYLSAGTWEDWRPDASTFPAFVMGNSLSWPGERWLDIRRLDVLGPIMEARLELCKAKGFDGVEPDNVDGYTNDTGFPLTAQDQLRYNVFLANAAHARGLSVGLKNDVDQVEEILPHFDWTLNESCFRYRECQRLLPFVAAGKAVFHVEYDLDARLFCAEANALGFNSMRKHRELTAFREPCR